MNLGPTEASSFIRRFLDACPPHGDRTVILFPPALSIATVRSALGSRTDVRIGVQNVHAEEKGAFTGENSATSAADAGASFVLVGHSERRQLFNETDDQCARKCARVGAHGLTPILCVGETLEQRESRQAESVVLHQLRTGLSLLSTEAMRTMIIAYEPVWAIGTGRTATPTDAAAMHRTIRDALVALVGAVAAEIPILYGGSVTVANAAALLATDEVDGVLVGGASIDPIGWATICNTSA